MDDDNKEMISLSALIKPYDFNIGICCHSYQLIRDIHYFIEETMKQYQMEYQIGRIELKTKSMWLLPSYKVEDCLSNRDELIVYSIDFAVKPQTTLSSLSLLNRKDQKDIDKKFIEMKRTKRKRQKKQSDTLTPKKPRTNSVLQKMAETAKRIEEEFYSLQNQ